MIGTIFFSLAFVRSLFQKFDLKKFFCLVFSLIILLGFTGCEKKAKNSGQMPHNGKINIVATIFPLFDFTKQIVGESANLHLLMKPGIDIHSFEPTPESIKIIENCDVLIYLGGEADSWVEKVLNSLSDEKRKKIKQVNVIRSLGFDSNTAIDPHVWTSLQNSINIAGVLESELLKIDSENASLYSKNLNLFVSSLEKLKHEFEQVVASGRRKVLVFADKFPFKHFVDEFNLKVVTPFHNCHAKSEVLSSKVSELVRFVNENSIPVVFKVDFGEENLIDAVVNETGARARIFYSCHTISVDDFKSGRSYIYFMEQNLKNLKEALN